MRKLKHEEINRRSPQELSEAEKHPVAVVLDNVRSLYNVGSIFRTSDAARIEKLYLTGITGTPNHRGLHKTALGSQDTVDWEQMQDAAVIVQNLKSSGYTIAALEITDEPMLPSDVTLAHYPLCLIVGNEISGVQDELISMADFALELPQWGAKQSMNVSVAYGVAIYDLVRRYRSLAHSSPSHF